MISVVHFEWQGKPATLAMISDITERKDAEKALREAEARYRDIFENAPVAIFRATPAGRFIVVNPTYAAMAGFASPRDMIEGITDIAAQMYVNPAVRDAYKREVARHGAVRDFEARLKRRAGGTFWASMTSRVVRDETGAIVFYDGFLTDVTTRKQAEEALRQARDTLEVQVAARNLDLQKANERLLELDRQRATFLSSASHELRTPLTSVLGFAKLARRTFCRHFNPWPGNRRSSRPSPGSSSKIWPSSSRRESG
jgi:PAS domain S-box-containing protein